MSRKKKSGRRELFIIISRHELFIIISRREIVNNKCDKLLAS